MIRDFKGDVVAVGVNQALRFCDPSMEEANTYIFALRKA